MLGIVRAGAVQVNVNPLYTPRELEHQLNDAGVEIIVIFNGVSADARRDHRQDRGQAGHQRRPGRRHRRGAAAARRWTRASTTSSPSPTRSRKARSSPLTPVAAERRRSAVPAIHRRHHRAFQGRRAVAPQPGRQHRAVQGVHAGRLAPRAGSGGHGAAALSHLRADGELHHLLLDRRRELAGAPIRATWTASSRFCKQARRTVFTGVNTLYGGLPMHPQHRRGGLHPACAWRSAAAPRCSPPTSAKWKALTGNYILRRLRPVGDLAGPLAQSGDDGELLGDRGPAVARRPTSSCSTTTTRKWRSAQPARSAPRARR